MCREKYVPRKITCHENYVPRKFRNVPRKLPRNVPRKLPRKFTAKLLCQKHRKIRQDLNLVAHVDPDFRKLLNLVARLCGRFVQRFVSAKMFGVQFRARFRPDSGPMECRPTISVQRFGPQFRSRFPPGRSVPGAIGAPRRPKETPKASLRLPKCSQRDQKIPQQRGSGFFLVRAQNPFFALLAFCIDWKRTYKRNYPWMHCQG